VTSSWSTSVSQSLAEQTQAFSYKHHVHGSAQECWVFSAGMKIVVDKNLENTI
jgi:hypothetical protein